MILRPFPSILSAGVLLLLVGCGDILGPGRDGTRGLWIRDTGVVLEPGESIALSARIQVSNNSAEAEEAGTVIVPPRNARWWTDNPAVLRVPNESSGRIEALAPGRATVWVQVGSRRDSANVTVLGAGAESTHRWKAVATWRSGTCALDVQGHAYCWGDDYYGNWGTSGDRRQWTNTHRPVRVNSPLAFEGIGVGLGFACARTAGGEVWCWGLHLGSQLGHGRTSVHFETGPVRVGFSGRAAALAVGLQHACLLDVEGRAHCWGMNLMQQLGVTENILGSGERGGRTLPVAFAGTFRSISTHGVHTCGITPAGELYCWGSIPVGPGYATVPVPTQVPTSVTPVRVEAGGTTTCFLTAAGEMHCFGSNDGGESGRPPGRSTDVPTPAAIELRFEDLALGGGMTCGIIPNGQAWCWGTGSALDPAALQMCGNIGTRFPCTGTPIPILGNLRFRSLSIDQATCGVTLDGELYCWGQNDRGQLGIGRPDVESTHIPQRVLDPL